MASDLVWEHQYCLGCDKQTDGNTYCSEACRLSDFDNSTSAPSTPATSPGLNGPTVSWTTPRPQARFYLAPAYDFSNAQPYGTTPRPQSLFPQRPQVSSTSSSSRALTPSSSHSSLCSLRSTSSTSTDDANVSDRARKELRDYASSFEHARVQRRRSY